MSKSPLILVMLILECISRGGSRGGGGRGGGGRGGHGSSSGKDDIWIWSIFGVFALIYIIYKCCQ